MGVGFGSALVLQVLVLYAYIITVEYDSNSDIDSGIDDKSIMLSVCRYKDFILMAQPEKFLEKYNYYVQ